MMRGYEQHHVDEERVYRFVRIERIMHWINALSFFVLVFTGLPMLLRRPLSLQEEAVGTLHTCHVCTGAVYFFGPALILLIGDWRAGLRWMREAARWTFSEILWLMGPMRKKVFPRRSMPETGRFNAGQRLNLLCQILGKWAMGITGYFMQFERGQLIMYDIHVVVFGGMLLLVAGHIYMGLINPATRHSRFAMLGGFVHLDWVMHHHPGWVKALPGFSPPPAPPALKEKKPAPSRKKEGKKK